MTPVNLIPKGRLEARRRRAAMMGWAGACGAYAAVLLLVFAGYFWGLTGASRAAAAELKNFTSAIEDTKRAITQIQPQLLEAQRGLEVSKAVSEQPEWNVLLGLVAQTQGDDVVLRGCQIEPSDRVREKGPLPVEKKEAGPAPPISRQPYTLTLRGLGRTQSAVSQFVLRLEKLGPFDRVKLIDTRREPFLENEAFAFHVECDMGQAGEAR